MKEIIRKAEEFALSEIEKHGLPSKINFETSNKKGLELAKNFDADIDLVQIGTRLMDIKLGQAFAEGNPKEHVQIGIEATKDFLSQFELSEDVKNKIINCVEAHHGTTEWKCKEAEICANADCYRFLLCKNWLAFLNSLGKNKSSFEENLEFAERKAEEKWNILSLDVCKEELTPHYKLIREIIDKAKNT